VVSTRDRVARAATPTPLPTAEADSTRLRLTFLTLLVVSLFVLLFARLWFLQVMAGERYATLAEGNAVRTVELEAPRGKILDRHGEPMVHNRFALVVSVQPAEMGERRDEVLADLADLLGLSVAEVEERIEGSRVSPFRPKPVALDVPEDIVFYIHENASTRYPGVYAERLPLRQYPHGSLAAHIVGYIGEVSAEELEQPEYADYRPGDLIGWAGVERSYEEVLRGSEGVRRLEVNARGQVLRSLYEELPVPGADLALTLDLEAQQLVEAALGEGMEVARTLPDAGSGPGRGGTFNAPAGAVAVLDPRNGEVVAMASNPTFEPARFVGGVSQDYWSWLQDPDNEFPLINRAIQSSYPPGSVFKIVPAAAALEYGYMSTTGRLECPPAWEWNTFVYRNWKRTHSGHLTLSEALVESCDTVFYELARRMWNDEQREAEAGAVFERFAVQSEAWGFGSRLGVDLPSERPGVVPSRAWKEDYWERHRETYCTKAQQLPEGSYAQQVNEDLCHNGSRWRGGDAVNMSIGQGDVLTTPLQMAAAYMAVANGGSVYRPHIGQRVLAPDGEVVREVAPEVIAELDLAPAELAAIQDGLLRVVMAERGTARGAFTRLNGQGDPFPLDRIPVAGKTGTAELKPLVPFAWFAAYAPADDPEVLVVINVEQGGGGSQTAAPIARNILEHYFGLLDAEDAEFVEGDPIFD
jgi:penicillin-binding protein 2